MFDSFDYTVQQETTKTKAQHTRFNSNVFHNEIGRCTNAFDKYLKDIHCYNRHTNDKSLRKYNTTQMEYVEEEEDDEDEDKYKEEPWDGNHVQKKEFNEMIIKVKKYKNFFLKLNLLKFLFNYMSRLNNQVQFNSNKIVKLCKYFLNLEDKI